MPMIAICRGFAVMLPLVWITAACDDQLKISVKNISISNKTTTTASSNTTSFKITGRSKFALTQGETVILTGVGFNSKITAVLSGSTVAPQINVNSSTEMALIIPAQATFGSQTATISQNGVSLTVSLWIIHDQKSDYPVMTLAPAAVCLGIKYYDSSNTLRQGTKACSSCTTDGQVGCVASAAFPAASVGLTGADAGNIKKDVVIGGITGQYPSASYLLPAAAGTDLTMANFNAQMTSVSAFQWYDSAGRRYTNTGDTNLSAGNIIIGQTIFGISGSYIGKPLCASDGASDCWVPTYDASANLYKAALISNVTALDLRIGKSVAGITGNLAMYESMADTITFNRTAGTGAQVGLDVYDTLDDFNNGGALPSQSNALWHGASLSTWLRDPNSDTGAGGGTASNSACDGTEDCVYIDQITGLKWSRSDGVTRDWETAITYCNNLVYGGYGWRLPTQKELTQAYIDGIWLLQPSSKLNLSTIWWDPMWSATTISTIHSKAWYVNPSDGFTFEGVKTDPYLVLCVQYTGS